MPRADRGADERKPRAPHRRGPHRLVPWFLAVFALALVAVVYAILAQAPRAVLVAAVIAATVLGGLIGMAVRDSQERVLTTGGSIRDGLRRLVHALWY